MGTTTTDLGLYKPALRETGYEVAFAASMDVIDQIPGKPARGIGAVGALVPTRFVGGTASAAPTTGTFAVGDFVVTSNGRMLICTAAGSPGTWVRVGGEPFSKGAAFANPAGVAASTVAVWTATVACTALAIKGYRIGGTGATVQAYRNTTGSPIRSAALSLSSASQWIDGGDIQNTAFAAGDSLLIAVASASGGPTQVSVQVNFKSP